MAAAASTAAGSADAKSSSAASNALFWFGIISDIQYADIENGWNYDRTNERFYRNTLKVAEHAIEAWNRAGRIAFAVHGGDLIDGFTSHPPRNKSHAWTDLETCMTVLNRLKVPLYHLIGNHDLYNFTRHELAPVWKIPQNAAPPPPATPPAKPAVATAATAAPAASGDAKSSSAADGDSDDEDGEDGPEPVCYYSFSPHSEFRFIALDTHDLSALGRPDSDPRTVEAVRLMRQFNSNQTLNDPTGLVGENRRWVKFNGGLDSTQLKWLESELTEAKNAKQKVIIFSHVPLVGPPFVDEVVVAWNAATVINPILNATPGLVVACVHGHEHTGGYFHDPKTGIHHICIPAPLNCAPGKLCYGEISVFSDRLECVGVGDMSFLTQTWKFGKPTATATTATATTTATAPTATAAAAAPTATAAPAAAKK